MSDSLVIRWCESCIAIVGSFRTGRVVECSSGHDIQFSCMKSDEWLVFRIIVIVVIMVRYWHIKARSLLWPKRFSRCHGKLRSVSFDRVSFISSSATECARGTEWLKNVSAWEEAKLALSCVVDELRLIESVC
ncbi:hypothetical protein AB6A40_000566 [Gnathostoma spinigerum]|uniref:Uncharacterized protein n=1 Tax=Gnathostoma spinigerum TaxID=75299 RepID=A0ABD6E4F2_9BILA